MSAEMGNYFYVCDRCGNIVTITAAPIPEDESWACDECGSSAMWEFQNADNARNHSEHIRRAVKSGLFREA